MQAVERGWVEAPNPFNRELYRVPLEPDKVSAIVFWSKNFRPFIDSLSELESKGFGNFIFNFTITGLPEVFEPNVPPVEYTLKDFKELSARYGEKAMFWRFDPIIFSDITGEDYYLSRFQRLADELHPYVSRCIFSFAFFYRKVERALRELEKTTGIHTEDPSLERKRDLAARLAEIAGERGLSLEACCCEYLLEAPGVKAAHCVDGGLVSGLWGGKYTYNPRPSREGCGCAESSDIGQYGLCKGGCVYCYAR